MLVLLIDGGVEGVDLLVLHEDLGGILSQRWRLRRICTPPHGRWDVTWEASDARARGHDSPAIGPVRAAIGIVTK